jgi:UDP-N-acetylglucosamine:LPS N-acetylglucosamine transferase
MDQQIDVSRQAGPSVIHRRAAGEPSLVPQRPKHAAILYTDSGYGHIATTNVLRKQIEQERGWQVTTIDLYRDVLAAVDPFKAITGIAGPDIYNDFVIRQGHTRVLWPAMASAATLALRAGSPLVVRRFAKLWQGLPIDMAISVMPLVNDALAKSMQRQLPHSPLVTIVTDFREPARRTWFQHKAQYVVCGTAESERQARQFGIAADQIYRMSGVIISPDFAEFRLRFSRHEARAAARRGVGLSPDTLTGLMMFGGQGAARMVDYAAAIERSDLSVQMIYACGASPSVMTAINQFPLERPRVVLGHSNEIARYMGLSDFFVGKPGPGAMAEALSMGLPLVLEANGKTLLQERYNLDWAARADAAILFKDPEHLVSGLRCLLQPSTFGRMQAAARQYHNQAISQILAILDDIFERHAARTRQSA